MFSEKMPKKVLKQLFEHASSLSYERHDLARFHVRVIFDVCKQLGIPINNQKKNVLIDKITEKTRQRSIVEDIHVAAQKNIPPKEEIAESIEPVRCLVTEHFDSFDVRVYGTTENPLFKMKEVGDILGLAQLKGRQFGVGEIEYLALTDTLGRRQRFTVLTEKGLYKFIFLSRKPIALEFQERIFQMLKKLRLNCRKELEAIIEAQRALVEQQKQDETVMDQECTANERYVEKGYVYIMTSQRYAKNYIYKIGHTKDYSKRLYSLNCANVFSEDQLFLCYARLVYDPKNIEALVHKLLSHARCNVNREFFALPLDYIRSLIDSVCSTYDKKFDLRDRPVKRLKNLDTDTDEGNAKVKITTDNDS